MLQTSMCNLQQPSRKELLQEAPGIVMSIGSRDSFGGYGLSLTELILTREDEIIWSTNLGLFSTLMAGM